MQLSEFKAWFEGYTEGLEGAPTKAQFDRIKAKVSEITGTPITYPVYIDRYVEPYRRYYATWASSGGAVGSGTQLLSTAGRAGDFQGEAAMYALGKAEAQIAA